LIAEAARGCRSDELRELLSVLDLDAETDGQVLEALRKGFEKFRRQNFENAVAAQLLGEVLSRLRLEN
jgi:hypothetical protein